MRSTQGDETMNKTMVSTVLWIVAAAILVLLIMRRRKRKMQG